jgi:hypothetical protein
MAIRVIKEADVTVTESELQRYKDEYNQAYMFYAGTPPTLEEFIRRKQLEPVANLWKGQATSSR